MDILFADGLNGFTLKGRGRDLSTRLDGSSVVIDEATMTAAIDAMDQTVLNLEVVPTEWQTSVAHLIGMSGGSGFRRAVYQSVPDGSVLTLLLSEVPVAIVIAAGSLLRRGLPPPWRSNRIENSGVCAGWVPGGTLETSLRTGERMYGQGPPAPSLTSDDPLAWHPLEQELPQGSMRRRRRIDLRSVAGFGGVFHADVFLRDSYFEEDGVESVVHEYNVGADIDETGRVSNIDVEANVLPGPECPGAMSSARRIIGMRLDEIRRSVDGSFVGTSTCTHLNDILRSLGDLGIYVDLLHNGG